MFNSPALMQLADSLHAERSGARVVTVSQERSPTIRTWLGRRMISLGERLTHSRPVTAAR
jgi:hypothetical protein